MSPRITHVISSPRGIGGGERVVAALLELSAARGWAASVLNPFASGGTASDLAALFAGADYQDRVTTRMTAVPGARSWLGAQIRQRRPDILHVHLFHALALTATLPRRSVPVRLLTHHHGNVFREQGRAVEARVDRWAGRRMDKVVAVSESVKAFLREGYGYPETAVTTIRNGWSGTPAEGVPKALRPTVICVAHFRREKAHDVLLDAFERVRRRLPDAQLVLVGQGPLEPELRALVARAGLGDGVRFAGMVDDVWPLLAAAHVFTLASVVEPLGIAVMEAMASGLPVVASRAGGIPELVDDGVTGVLVPPGDAGTLAAALGDLLGSPQRQAAMGAAARRSAAGMTMDSMLDAYEDLYERLLAEAASRPVGR